MSLKHGLSASEVLASRARHGPNRLVGEEPWAWLKGALSIMADPMALMLLGGGLAFWALGERVDGAILLAALVPVMGVDVVLEARSRQALKQLAQAVGPSARVMRDGREQQVPSEDVVPGDLLLLHEGDVAQADGVVGEAANLTLDESSLTGESEPVVKQAGDRFFAGSLVLTGQAHGEVEYTGSGTRFGQIARLMEAAPTVSTPIQRRLMRLVKQLGAVALLVAALVMFLTWARGAPLQMALMSGISLAMAAIPEEFLLVFSLFLTLGAWRLSQKGVLVRRLASVETLGSTTVIGLDKTGTLTCGEFCLEQHLPLAPTMAEGDLLEAAVLACEPHPADAMERAIVAHCHEHGVPLAHVLSCWRLTFDYPFELQGKHMAHVWRATAEGGGWRLVAKGALEGILEHCRLTADELAAIESAHASLAGQGMRVLAVAGRMAPEMTGEREQDERDLTFYGLLGFGDPLRPEVREAVAECLGAGIQLKVITGDHALTAHAIASAAGIPEPPGGLVTGSELDELEGEALAERVRQATIFARIRPEQKHMIVDGLMREGQIVAMTGDGINDAPALKRADIGISMGARATQVARAAADMVLLNDSFAALVATVREGRQIFGNIQKSFLYLLAFHTPIILLTVTVPLLGWPLLVLPLHMVWLELIIHPVSALLFENEPPPPDLMRRPPRAPEAPLLPRGAVFRSLLSAGLLTVSALAVFAGHVQADVVYARSCALAVVILGGVWLIWAERAGDRSWRSLPWPTGWRFWLVVGAIVLSLPLLMAWPLSAELLQVTVPALRDWGLALALSAVSVGWRAWGPGGPRTRIRSGG